MYKEKKENSLIKFDYTHVLNISLFQEILFQVEESS